MTKFGRIIEEEKRQALAQIEEEKRQAEEEKQHALEQLEKEKKEKRDIVAGMLK